jgi:hypothetical protein
LLDKKSYKLLKKLCKVDFLTYQEIDNLLGTNTPSSQLNSYSQNLVRNQLIDQHYVGTDENGDYIFDGYQANLDGNAYVWEQQKKFWNFLLPYTITTLIALLSLISTILMNYDDFVSSLSKIAQIVH